MTMTTNTQRFIATVKLLTNVLLPGDRTIVLALGATLCAGVQVHAETTRVGFPENLAQLVHYTTVTRGEVTEHMLTSREAINAVKNGKPIPHGTRFVLVDYRDGKVHRYFVMETGPAWGADYETRRRTGDWQFQWFWPDKSINTKENTARCQSCHQSRQDSNYLYTFEQLRAFALADTRAP
jgi:hypothetical protein